MLEPRSGKATEVFDAQVTWEPSFRPPRASRDPASSNIHMISDERELIRQIKFGFQVSSAIGLADQLRIVLHCI